MSSNRRPLCFGTNLKMHQTPEETTAFVGGVRAAVGDVLGREDVNLFVIPPFTSLSAAVEAARGSGLWIGAQNVHPAEEGAFTGEISTRMLQGLGVDLVLIGHAERRGLFGESDAFVNEKVRAALANGLRVLVCVGETAAEKGYGVGPETVVRQLKIALHGVGADAIEQVMVGYEPVWSIGAGGTPARPADVAVTAGHLRASLRELYIDHGDAVPILYGGSVDPTNVAGFVGLDDIDGAFIGRSAWTVEGYEAVLRAALHAGGEAEDRAFTAPPPRR
jgi:L-erythrulose 1-phosphate isomerase